MEKAILGIIISVGIAVGIALFLIWLPEEEPYQLNSIISKPMYPGIALYATEQEPCYTIDDDFLGKYPAIADGIKRADEEASLPRITPVGDKYDGQPLELSRDAALSLITKLPFKHTVNEHKTDSIQDESHIFQCTLQYKNRFYDLRIEFEGFQAPLDSGYSLIRITRDKSDRIMLEPENATAWLSFNATVVWKNELSDNISIVSDGNSPVQGFDEVATSSNIIPSGKIWYFTFRPDWVRYTDETFHYRVEPYGIDGVVNLKIYPRCMSQEVVKSLYAQSGLDVMFPKYLPEGYKYQCGIHILGTAVALTYWNGYSQDPNFLYYGISQGVIQILATKELEYRDKDNAAETAYEGIKDLQPLDATFLMINGNPAVASKGFDGVGKHQALTLYLDRETYYFKGMVPLEELVKMAESLSLQMSPAALESKVTNTKYNPTAGITYGEPIQVLRIPSKQVAAVVYGVNEETQDLGAVLELYHAINGTNNVVAVTIKNVSNRPIAIDKLAIIGKNYDPANRDFQDALISIPILSKSQQNENADAHTTEPVYLGRGNMITAHIQGSWPDVHGFYAEAHYSYRDGNNYTIKMSQPWWKDQDYGLKLLEDITYKTVSQNADYNLMLTMDYATKQDLEGFRIIVKNIGEHKIKLDGVHLSGVRCFDEECNGEFYIMDHHMLGTDSSSPMYPVFPDEFELQPGESIASTITGSWFLAQKFRAGAGYSTLSEKSWLDEHRFSVLTIWNKTSVAPERDFTHAGTALHYYHIYEGMPEPYVYVYKSLSIDKIEDAISSAKETTQIIDRRSVIKSLAYEPDATIYISDVAAGVSSIKFNKPQAAYIFALVPIKLSTDQLALLINALEKYGFNLIGHYTGYEIAKDHDEDIALQMNYQNIQGKDNVSISITNIGSKDVIIQSTHISVKNILDENSYSSKGIYNFIAPKHSFPEPAHEAPFVIRAGETVTGSIIGDWSDWQIFMGFVSYEVDEQVKVGHRVTSEVER